MRSKPTIRPRKPSEDGYMLIAVMILLAIFIAMMLMAAPRISADIQRDREVETMHRGKQYVRGIQLYYKRFKRYPPNIDALVKTNEIRFVRKKYIDPITGKDDWKPIQFGQNKTPQAMGFFGQPLAGTGGAVMAGTGPDGSAGLTGSSSLFPSTEPSAAAGTTPTGTTGQTGGFDTTVGNTGGLGTGSTNSNQTIGGMGLIGVSPASEKASILVLKKKKKYDEWEFLYSPLMEMQMMQGGNGGAGGLPTNTGSPGFSGGGSNTGFPGNSGITNPTGNNGSTPVAPPTTDTPQTPQP